MACSVQRAACSVLCAVCCVLATGCVHRLLTIRSQPPGAELIVNGTRLGFTPYSYDFLWYGWYQINLSKDGYERLDDRVLLKAPVSLWIPGDLIAEMLPVQVRDERTLSYTLIPRPPLPEPSPPVTSPTTSSPQPKRSSENAHGQTR